MAGKNVARTRARERALFDLEGLESGSGPGLGPLSNEEVDLRLEDALSTFEEPEPATPAQQSRARGATLGRTAAADQSPASAAGGRILAGLPALAVGPVGLAGAFADDLPSPAALGVGVADDLTFGRVDELGGVIGGLLGGEGPLNQSVQGIGRGIGIAADTGDFEPLLMPQPGRRYASKDGVSQPDDWPGGGHASYATGPDFLGQAMETGRRAMNPEAHGAEARQYTEQARGGIDAAREEAPGSFMAGQLIGEGMKAGLVRGPSGLVNGVLPRIGLAGAEGAASGFTYGTGESENDPLSAEWFQDALPSTGFGAAGGLGGQVIGEGLGALGNLLRRQAAPQRAVAHGMSPADVERTIGEGRPALERWHEAIMETPGGTPFMATPAETAEDILPRLQQARNRVGEIINTPSIPQAPPIVPPAPPPPTRATTLEDVFARFNVPLEAPAGARFRDMPTEEIQNAMGFARAWDRDAEAQARNAIGTAVARPRRPPPIPPDVARPPPLPPPSLPPIVQARPGSPPTVRQRPDQINPRAAAERALRTEYLESDVPGMREIGRRALEQAPTVAMDIPRAQHYQRQLSRFAGGYVHTDPTLDAAMSAAARGVRDDQETALDAMATGLDQTAGDQLRGARRTLRALEPVGASIGRAAVRQDARPIVGGFEQINMGQGPAGAVIGAASLLGRGRMPAIRASAGETLLRLAKESPAQLGPYAQILGNAARRSPAAFHAALFQLQSSDPRAREDLTGLANAPQGAAEDEGMPPGPDPMMMNQQELSTGLNAAARGRPLTPRDREILLQNDFTEEDIAALEAAGGL